MTFVFNPRDLIHGPFVDCPKCRGDHTFGILMINHHNYVRRCKKCWYDQSYSLPSLQKKVLYLDQFAISQMMKALNPHVNSHGKDALHAFWYELFERIDRLCKLQVLVCPTSEFHTDESLISPFNAPLKRMYELLAGGVAFISRHEIECAQLGEATKQWAEGVSPPVHGIQRRRVLRGDLTGWQDRLIISVEWSDPHDWIGGIRTHRQQVHQGLAGLFEYWRVEKKSFWEVFQDECRSYGPAIIDQYRAHLESVANAYEGRLPENMDDLLPTLSAQKVHYIREAMVHYGIPPAESLRKTIEFLTSPDIQHVAHVRIAGMLYASLARRVVAGMKKPPNEGLATDVIAISTLLPYCDAMLVDREFASILCEDALVKGLSFGTKVFSTKSRNDLLAYLDELEAAITPEHKALVREVYGPDWPTPFTSLYTYERKRKGKPS